MTADPFVVVGGDAAGLSAASKCKREAPDRDVVVFEKGRWVSYAHCDTPYFVKGEVEQLTDLLSLSPTETDDRGIDLRREHEVVDVDTDGRTVSVRAPDGDRVEQPYGDLLVATGAHALTAPIGGSDLPGAFSLHGLGDAAAIRAALEPLGEANPRIAGRRLPRPRRNRPLRRVGAARDGRYRRRRLRRCRDGRGVHGPRSRHPPLPAERARPRPLRRGRRRAGRDGATQAGRRAPRGDRGRTADWRRPRRATGVCRRYRARRGPRARRRRHPTERGSRRGHARRTGRVGGGRGRRLRAHGRRRRLRRRRLRGGAPHRHRRVRLDGARADGQPGRSSSRSDRRRRPETDRRHRRDGRRQGLRPGVRTGRYRRPRASARSGLRPRTETITTASRSGYYPGAAEIVVSLTADRESGRLLGGTIVGTDRAAVRIDTVATALEGDMTVDEVETLDLAYAPPFSPVWDPVLTAAKVLNGSLEETAGN